MFCSHLIFRLCWLILGIFFSSQQTLHAGNNSENNDTLEVRKRVRAEFLRYLDFGTELPEGYWAYGVSLDLRETYGASLVYDVVLKKTISPQKSIDYSPVMRFAYFGPNEIRRIAVNPINSPMVYGNGYRELITKAYESRTGLHEWASENTKATVAFKVIDDDRHGEIFEAVLVARERSSLNQRDQYLGPILRFRINWFDATIETYVPPSIDRAYVVFVKPEVLNSETIDAKKVMMAEIDDKTTLATLREYLDFRYPNSENYPPFARHPINIQGTFNVTNDGSNVPWHYWSMTNIELDKSAYTSRQNATGFFNRKPVAGKKSKIMRVMPLAMLNSYGAVIAGNYPIARQLNFGDSEDQEYLGMELTAVQRFFWPRSVDLLADSFTQELRRARMPQPKSGTAALKLQTDHDSKPHNETIKLEMGTSEHEALRAVTKLINSEYNVLTFLGEDRNNTTVTIRIKFTDVDLIYDGLPVYFSNNEHHGLNEDIVKVELSFFEKKDQYLPADHGMLRIKKVLVDDDRRIVALRADLIFATAPTATKPAYKAILKINAPMGCDELFERE